MKVRFGELTFDAGRRMLFRGSQPVPVSPKAFQLLELLLLKRPDAVSKTDIQDVLWPGTFVSESSLHVLVNEVRRALGQRSRGPGFVRTVRGFGYSFDGDVRVLAPSAASTRRHVLVRGAQEFELSEGETSSAASPRFPSESTTSPFRASTPGSPWRADGRRSKIWEVRTGRFGRARG